MSSQSVFEAIRDRSLAAEERSTVRVKLEQWLTEEGYVTKALKDAQTHFTFAVEHRLGIILTVGQLLKNKDRITIIGTLDISDEDQKKLREIPEKQRNDFLWDLKFALLSNDIPFEMLANNLIPYRILVTQAIWYDGLTKDRFMQTIHRAIKAVVMVLWKFDQLSGAPAPKQEPSSYVM